VEYVKRYAYIEGTVDTDAYTHTHTHTHHAVRVAHGPDSRFEFPSKELSQVPVLN
jgi:hypothetical protein